MNLVSVPNILIGALILSMAGVLSSAVSRVLNRKKAYRSGADSRNMQPGATLGRAVVCSVLALTSLAAGAATTTELIGDFYYTLNDTDKTAILIKPTTPYTVAEVTIPVSVTDQNGVTYNVTGIGSKAFANSTALTSMSIPGTITSLGASAFQGCSNLASLRFEPGEQPLSVPENVFEIKDTDMSGYAPLYCYIGRELQFEGVGSFLQYTNVQKCEIENIKILGNRYINSSETLSELILHEGLEKIDAGALFKLTLLKSLVIPEGVTNIIGNNFDKCNALERVSLPSTLVETYKFYDTSLLSYIEVHSDIPPTVNPASATNPYPDNASATGVVHVHADALQAYKESPWGQDSRYTVQGDLSETIVTKDVIIAATGPGSLALTEIDGVAAQDFTAAKDAEQTLKVDATSENLTFTAQPDAAAEVAEISATDKDGLLLPATVTVAGGAVSLHIGFEPDMRVSARFNANTAATLHVIMPGGKSGPLTLQIPSGAPYSLQYTSTPGYELSAVMLDEEELTFTALEQQPDTQAEETPETTETGTTVTYQIVIPAFEGERTLRMAEEEGGIQTGVEGVEDGQGGDSAGIRARLVYKEGRACIIGLRPGDAVSIYSPKGELLQTLQAGSEICFMPSSLSGLHLITVSGRTFKAVL